MIIGAWTLTNGLRVKLIDLNVFGHKVTIETPDGFQEDCEVILEDGNGYIQPELCHGERLYLSNVERV